MLLPVFSYIYLMFVSLVYPPHLGMVDTGVNMACICVYAFEYDTYNNSSSHLFIFICQM